MIKNDRQYSITKSKLNDFINKSQTLNLRGNLEFMDKILLDSINSQIITFQREIAEYESLKNDKPTILCSTIEDLPQNLIKARIIKGYSHKELADLVGMQEQQIQRYEANNYSVANLNKMIFIAQSMDLRFAEVKMFLEPTVLKVDGIAPELLLQATHKLQSRKSLFCPAL